MAMVVCAHDLSQAIFLRDLSTQALTADHISLQVVLDSGR